jgi:hypothetical protein
MGEPVESLHSCTMRHEDIINDHWTCPVCSEQVGHGQIHEHPFVPYAERTRPDLMQRRCHSCNVARFIWRMAYNTRPLGGRSYWTCRPCRP